MEKINTSDTGNAAAITSMDNHSVSDTCSEKNVIKFSDMRDRKLRTKSESDLLTCRPGGESFESKISRIGRHCIPEYGNNQDAVTEVVNKFTELLNNAFGLIQETMNGLFELINKKEAEVEADPLKTDAEIAEEEPVNEISGEETTSETETETTATREAKSSALAKTGEFLWKPESDKDGKLAILLPGKLTGKVKKVRVVDADGNVLAKGKYSGTGNGISNNEREHYRFDKSGSKFPDGVTVEIQLKNGNTKKVKIKETSERKVH